MSPLPAMFSGIAKTIRVLLLSILIALILLHTLLHTSYCSIRRGLSNIRFYASAVQWRLSNTRFSAIDENGIPGRPTHALDTAVSLAKAALNVFVVNKVLASYITQIFVEMQHALDPSLSGPDLPPPRQWRHWLLLTEIKIVFSPYLNQSRWGWVVKEEEGEQDYSMKILRDLAELAYMYRTPSDFHLSSLWFQFWLAITLLHEFAHLLTKYAFAHQLTPNTILEFGEAGEGFEHKILGAKLVCEWDEGHVADFRHLRGLLLRDDGENGEIDYVLEDEDIKIFLHKLFHPKPMTHFKFNLQGKSTSTTPPGRTRTIIDTQDARIPLRAIADGTLIGFGLYPKDLKLPSSVPIPPGRVRTRPMLGKGICQCY